MNLLELYSQIQALVQQDIKHATTQLLTEDKYSVAQTPAHTHNGTDSPSFPFANLSDDTSYLAIQTITLTPAEIKALNTTPITIVPKPVKANLGGSGAPTPKAVNIVLGITARLAYAGTAYTGTHALEFRYTDASGSKVTADISTTFLNATASAYDYVSGVVTELVPVGNSPIIVTVPTANPAAGNSPITFVVHYRIVSFNA